MKLGRYLTSILFLMGLIFAGCGQSFNHRIRSLPPPMPTAKEVRAAIEVSVEEFVSATKARMTFDADVARHGVLALLVRMENRSNKDYKAWKRQIKAYLDGKALPRIYGYKAARQVASQGYWWKAPLTIAAIPLGLFIYPTTVTLVDRRVEHHFERIEFTDKLLKPNDVALGFVYFKIPGGWFSSKRLENLTVNVTLEEDSYGERNGNPLYFELSLPTLEVS